jgi:hypothetical protein
MKTVLALFVLFVCAVILLAILSASSVHLVEPSVGGPSAEGVRMFGHLLGFIH